MITPEIATIILCVFLLVFGVSLPLMHGFKKTSRFVSYRWCVVVVILALAIGSVIDFSHLSENIRSNIILGSFIIGGGYIALRTLEKLIHSGWRWDGKVVASKGDAKIEITGSEDKDKNNN